MSRDDMAINRGQVMNLTTDDRSNLDVLDFICWDGKKIPERQWLVTDWIPSGSVTALYGDGGMGKSLLAQMLLTACAIGKPWLGLPTTACKSFGVFCEDSTYELVRRQSAINRYFDVEFGDLENMQGLCRIADDNLFMTFDASGQRL